MTGLERLRIMISRYKAKKILKWLCIYNNPCDDPLSFFTSDKEIKETYRRLKIRGTEKQIYFLHRQ